MAKSPKRRPLLGWMARARLGSVQQHYVGIQAVQGNVLHLAPLRADARRAVPDVRAIIAIDSVNYALKSEAEQRDLLEAFRAFLNGVPFDLQILVRVMPLDMRTYADRVRELGADAPTLSLQNLAADHADYLTTLMQRRTLLTRAFYLVLGANLAKGARPKPTSARDFLAFLRPGKVASLTYTQAVQQLDLRVEKVLGELGRVGLVGQRLEGHELVQCYYACVAPEQAAHPLSEEQIAGSALPSQPHPNDTLVGETQQLGISLDTQTAASDVPWPELADLVAPGSVELHGDDLLIDHTWVRTLAITGYPRYVYAGWLERLIDLDEPMDLSLHLHPQDTTAVIRRLSHQLVALSATQREHAKQGRLTSVEQNIALSDIEQMRVKLQRGDERLFAFSLYLCVRAHTHEALEERTSRIETACENLQLTTRSMTFEQDLGFLSCLPEGRDRLRRTQPADTSTVTMAFPFVSNSLSMSDGILWGSAPNGSPIILDLFSAQLENANTCLFAKSGAGKSYTCKLVALRHLLRGVDVYVIDPEDEYAPLVAAAEGQTVYLSAGASQHINPFDLPVRRDHDERSDVLKDKVQSLHALMDLLLANRGPTGSVPLSQEEKGLLDRAMNTMYRNAGINAHPDTHTRPAPLMKDLYAILESGECGPDDTHLAQRLYRYVFGSLSGMFAEQTNIALDNHFVCFSIREMDAELRPLGLYLITEFVWTHMRGSRRPRFLIIDEAWTLLRFEEGGRFLSDLARRARKYYLGLFTITQNAEDFLSNEHGRTMLNNSSVKLLLGQDSTTIDPVTVAFKLSQAERHYLLGCSKGEGLIFARTGHVGVKVEASSWEHQLATTDPRELAAREAAIVEQSTAVHRGSSRRKPV
jgi:hypothetical protein